MLDQPEFAQKSSVYPTAPVQARVVLEGADRPAGAWADYAINRTAVIPSAGELSLHGCIDGAIRIAGIAVKTIAIIVRLIIAVVTEVTRVKWESIKRVVMMTAEVHPMMSATMVCTMSMSMSAVSAMAMSRLNFVREAEDTQACRCNANENFLFHGFLPVDFSSPMKV